MEIYDFLFLPIINAKGLLEEKEEDERGCTCHFESVKSGAEHKAKLDMVTFSGVTSGQVQNLMPIDIRLRFSSFFLLKGLHLQTYSHNFPENICGQTVDKSGRCLSCWQHRDF